MQTNQSMSTRLKIAERLKEARNLAGLSQESAAKMLDLQRPTLSEIESGKRKVTAEEIIQFSSTYRVSKSWLLLEEEGKEQFKDEQLRIAARELSKMSERDRKKLIEILRILPDA